MGYGEPSAQTQVRVELTAKLMGRWVTCASGRWLFKSPWAKAVIGPRAGAGLSQLLEREERPQLWKAKARTGQGSHTVTFQA